MRCIINVWIVFRCVSTWVFLCLHNNNSALEKYRNSNETKPWEHIYGIHSAYSFHISLTQTHAHAHALSFCVQVHCSYLEYLECSSHDLQEFILEPFSLWIHFHFIQIIYILLYSDIRPFVCFHGWCNHKHETFITKQKRNNSKNSSSFRGPPEVEYGKIYYTIKCTPTTL